METFWFFNMNGVGVAAASNETYTKDGAKVKPVKKMMEVKPGVLCSVIGPYEGIQQYLLFIAKRFELDKDLSAAQAIEDVNWMINKEEVNVNELAEAIGRLKEIMEKPENYDLEEEIEKLENLKIIKEMGSTRLTEEEMQQRWKMNLLLNQIKIIERNSDAFITHALTVDPFTNRANRLNYYEKHSDTPLFNQWGLQKWQPGVIEFGHVILGLRKEYESKKFLYKDETAIVIHLQEMISELDAKHNPEPAPLEFMKCCFVTNWRWLPVE